MADYISGAIPFVIGAMVGASLGMIVMGALIQGKLADAANDHEPEEWCE